MWQTRESKTQNTLTYAIVSCTAAPRINTMKLTQTERERITDGVLKIQSVRASLEHVDKSKIPNEQGVDECLATVDHHLREALGYQPSPKKKG